eukprot:399283-Rhodomonas_salina.3
MGRQRRVWESADVSGGRRQVSGPLILCCVTAKVVANMLTPSHTDFMCMWNDYPLLKEARSGCLLSKQTELTCVFGELSARTAAVACHCAASRMAFGDPASGFTHYMLWLTAMRLCFDDEDDDDEEERMMMVDPPDEFRHYTASHIMTELYKGVRLEPIVRVPACKPQHVARNGTFCPDKVNPSAFILRFPSVWEHKHETSVATTRPSAAKSSATPSTARFRLSSTARATTRLKEFSAGYLLKLSLWFAHVDIARAASCCGLGDVACSCLVEI